MCRGSEYTSSDKFIRSIGSSNTLQYVVKGENNINL